MGTSLEPAGPLTGRTAEAELHRLIADECVDDTVLKYVLDHGRPHSWEGTLWDYKRDMPDTSGKGNDAQKAAAQDKIAELVKDIVAFHNALGGYIVAGVDQHANHPFVGSANIEQGKFTVDKLNDQVRLYTRTAIACRFRKIASDVAQIIGLLLIPMRKAQAPVVRMTCGAPDRDDGSSAFKKGDVYARIGDKSLPVHDDLQGIQFVCSSRQFDADETRQVETNLPLQDPDLIEFVGRTKYLLHLWSWLVDRNAPLKIITALGGTGKTAVAFEFCRRLVLDPPSWLHKLVWLTGKTEVFSQVMGKAVGLTRTDFKSVNDFLAALAREVGAIEDEISGADRDVLIELILEGLREFPSLVVVDDVDSLPLKEQADLFSIIQILAGRAFERGSRFLLTSRLDLGAGDSQLIPLGGFEKAEFVKYAKIVAGESLVLTDGVIDLLFKASLGSPIFCVSILKIVKDGTDISKAIGKWKGKEGEEVREFAFSRELGQLTDWQRQTLFALSLLGETTQLELEQVLGVSDTRITVDLAKLREFHLFTSRGDPSTGAKLEVPEPIRLMNRILRKQLSNASRIEKRCARARKEVPKVQDKVQTIIAGILALWKAKDYEAALLSAKQAESANPKSGDINYFLARTYLMVKPPQPYAADKAFAKAFKQGCSRPELVPNWMEARNSTRNWAGIVQLANSVPPTHVRGRVTTVYMEAMIQVARESYANNDTLRSVAQMREAMREADNIIQQERAGERLPEILDKRKVAAEHYVQYAKQLHARPSDRIDVFNAAIDALNCDVFEPWFINVALESIEVFAKDVVNRKKDDPGALHILETRTAGLSELREQLTGTKPCSPSMLVRIDNSLKELHMCISQVKRKAS